MPKATQPLRFITPNSGDEWEARLLSILERKGIAAEYERLKKELTAFFENPENFNHK